MDGNAIQEMLDQLMLKEEGPTYPRDLSTGERQRVALGAMSITKPQVLILDEPTRGLDQLAKNSLLALLKEWNAKGVTILMVTHDVELAASFASRVILLEEGHLIADGDPRKIMHQFPRYRTQIAQLFPDSGLLTVEDLELRQESKF
jgi:ABC-type multidrug transport system ATPase subunit